MTEINSEALQVAAAQESEMMNNSVEILTAQKNHMEQRVVQLRAYVNHLEAQLAELRAPTELGDGVDPVEKNPTPEPPAKKAAAKKAVGNQRKR